MTQPTTDKVPPSHAFLDFSDYARPFARWLVARLAPTHVSPNHITLAFTLAGLAAAALLAANRGLWLAGGLLVVKSMLDAADGSLARARGRPSRVGRFLDSVCDFVVNVAVYGAIAWAAWRASGQAGYLALGAFALVSGMLQVSVFNHYYVRYRAQTGGDRTSNVREDAAGGYPWDNPRLLAWLHAAYVAIYGWQDRFVAWLDQLPAPRAGPLNPRFMTATTVLGLGTQLLVLAVLAALGRPVWGLWVIATLFNLYALILVFAGRR